MTLPFPAGTWRVDPAHSGVHFKVRHLALTSVPGRFNSFDAHLNVGADLAATESGATIDLSTIDPNNQDRATHLRTTDFFGTDAHPTLEFTSTSIVDRGNGDCQTAGDLTLHGVTHPVVLDVEFTGAMVHPGDGLERAGSSPRLRSCAMTSGSTSTRRSVLTSSLWGRRSTSRSTSGSCPRAERQRWSRH